MKLKSTLIGVLLYSGLLLIALSAAMLFFGLCAPFPVRYLLTFLAVTLFCDAFLIHTLQRANLLHLSISTVLMYLVCLIVIAQFAAPLHADESLYLAALFAVIWIIAAAGALTALWSRRRWPSVKAQRRRVAAGPLVLVMTVIGLFAVDAGRVIVSGARASKLTAPALSCSADSLKSSRVVPELDAPLTPGTNLIWCAPFQLAWNELMEFTGAIRLTEDEPDYVAHLNQRMVRREHLDPESCIASAGPYTRDFIRQMNKDLSSRFGHGQFAPEPVPETDGKDRLVAYGYLSVNLPFRHAFQRSEDPLFFNGTPVQSFTLPFGTGSEIRAEKAESQVRVLYPPEDGAFMVELLTAESDHHLILAQIAPEATLQATVDKAIRYADTLPRKYLEDNQALIVPLFNFDITKTYHDVMNRPLAAENPEYSGWSIEEARQKIRFQLDERGAVLNSSAFMVCVKSVPPSDCIFDQPFLLMITYKESTAPYFAIWVDNAEILTQMDLPAESCANAPGGAYD